MLLNLAPKLLSEAYSQLYSSTNPGVSVASLFLEFRDSESFLNHGFLWPSGEVLGPLPRVVLLLYNIINIRLLKKAIL